MQVTKWLQDKAEADWGGLRVSKDMLWNTDRRKPKIAKGASRIKSLKDLSAFLHATSSHHAHHVSFLWASRHHHSTQHNGSPQTAHQWLSMILSQQIKYRDAFFQLPFFQMKYSGLGEYG